MLGKTSDSKRNVLILLALFTGGAVPIQLITLSFGYAQYFQGISKGPQLIKTAHQFAIQYVYFAYIPALLILGMIAIHCRRHYPDIFRRIAIGFSIGMIGTLALDAAREAGVIHGWLPGDTVVMFGKVVTASKSFAIFYPVGLFVHYVNGAGFGLFYAFVWGKRESFGAAARWGVFWLLIVELGMMTLPPMGPLTGLFGVRFHWPGLFLVTLVAHVFSGLTMGLLIQHFLGERERGGFYDHLMGNGKAS